MLAVCRLNMFRSSHNPRTTPSSLLSKKSHGGREKSLRILRYLFEERCCCCCKVSLPCLRGCLLFPAMCQGAQESKCKFQCGLLPNDFDCSQMNHALCLPSTKDEIDEHCFCSSQMTPYSHLVFFLLSFVSLSFPRRS